MTSIRPRPIQSGSADDTDGVAVGGEVVDEVREEPHCGRRVRVEEPLREEDTHEDGASIRDRLPLEDSHDASESAGTWSPMDSDFERVLHPSKPLIRFSAG